MCTIWTFWKTLLPPSFRGFQPIRRTRICPVSWMYIKFHLSYTGYCLRLFCIAIKCNRNRIAQLADIRIFKNIFQTINSSSSTLFPQLFILMTTLWQKEIKTVIPAASLKEWDIIFILIKIITFTHIGWAQNVKIRNITVICNSQRRPVLFWRSIISIFSMSKNIPNLFLIWRGKSFIVESYNKEKKRFNLAGKSKT